MMNLMAGPISTGLKSGPPPTQWDCDFKSRVGPADDFIGIDSEDPNSFLKNLFSSKNPDLPYYID